MMAEVQTLDIQTTRVHLRDVAPRLALQAHLLPTTQKVELIERLLSAGIKEIEVSSFVRPDLVPGLADAEEVFRQLGHREGVTLDCCVGNVSGLKRAAAAGADRAWFLLATDNDFALHNTGRSIEQQLTELGRIMEAAQGTNTRIGTYLIAVFGGPVSLPRAPEEVTWLMERLKAMGVEEWILADSCGYASPLQMRGMVEAASAFMPLEQLRVQIHDSRGMGLANIAELVRLGVTHIDTALAGSGAHPAAPGAQVGGVCTEDAVQLLDRLGVETGIDLPALIATANWFDGLLGGQGMGFTRNVGRVPTDQTDLEDFRAAQEHFTWNRK
ncbi:hypothetical protein [Deinococcus sp. UYEF24]